MTRYHWTLDGDIYRLRPEGGPPGSSVVSLWLEGDRWQRIVWLGGGFSVQGETMGGPLVHAQHFAIEHARRVGAMSGEDKVEG